MSVPIKSDGMEKFIMENMSKGWTQAERYVSKFLLPAKGSLKDVIRSNPRAFRPPKPPNLQLYDADSCPIITELPDGYSLLANASMGGTLGIFGHPSGQHFRNALDFLPHFQWLGSRDVVNNHCSCRLCAIVSQQEDFMRQATNLSQSPSNNSFISPFGQMGLDTNSFFPSLDIPGSQSNAVNMLGGLNDNNILSPGGITTPIELFPSHLSNLNHIPQQTQFSIPSNQRILMEENQEQVQNITGSPQAPQPSPIQAEELNPLEAPTSQRIGSPINTIITPSPSFQEQPTKNTKTKAPRKPKTKKSKAPDAPSSSNTPHNGTSNIINPPETPDVSMILNQPIAPINIESSPKVFNPSPIVSAEDPMNSQKVMQLQTANKELRKDISMLVLYIKRYEKKIDRLKFERKLLLNSLNAQSNLALAKRYRDDTTDSLGTERDAESEILHIDDMEVPERPSKMKKKTKKKKTRLLDPNAPKRPANAFIMFCDLQRMSMNTERRLLQKLDPDSEDLKSMGQLTKALGSKWRNLNENEKKEYQDMFHEQVQWYDVEIKQYMAAHPNAPNEGGIEPLPENWADPYTPKRPANAFFVFCDMEDERLKKLENELMDVGENGESRRSLEEDRAELDRVSMALISRWRMLSEEKRKGYVDEYEARLKEYNKYKSTKIAASGGPANVNNHLDNLETVDEDDELEYDDNPHEESNFFNFESSPRLDHDGPEDESEDDMDITNDAY